MNPFSALRRFRHWLSRHPSHPSRPRTAGVRRPRVEPLEDRRLLAAILYVNDDAAGLNTGASWNDAYTDLQSALAAAATGDEIWVAAGTYKPTATADRSISFNLKDGVALYGGFAGTETTRDQRNWTTNVTTLSGDIGEVGNQIDNSHHVVVACSVSSAVIDGLTITGGAADSGASGATGGAGLYSENSSPTLTNIEFSGNWVTASQGTAYGGGMYVAGGSPSLTHIRFVDNVASSATQYCQAHGGALYMAGASLTISQVTFARNQASVATWGYARGAGIYASGGSLVLANGVFDSNHLLSDNMISEGAAVYVADASVSIACVTLNNNYAPVGANHGDAIHAASGTVRVSNGILWGDPANGAKQIVGSADVTYSIIQGGWSGQGNLDRDPLFVDASHGNLHLQAGSPAVDTGTSAGAPLFDLDGLPRPFRGGVGTPRVDIGAYESAFANQLPVADAGGPYFAVAGYTVVLSGAASYDPDNTIATYEWDFDYDGTTFDVDATCMAPTFSAANLRDGDARTVAIRTTDYAGDASIDTAVITARGPKRIYVNQRAAGLNDGTNWTDAFTDLQTAMAATPGGDDIWVAAGSYKPTTNTDSSISFNLKPGMSLYGGFVGTETSLAQRDWAANITTLSGEIGQADYPYDNTLHVLVASGVTTATVDGFTIEAGRDRKIYSSETCCGAGMYSLNSSPILRHVTFRGNTADSSVSGLGGALYVSGGSPTLIDLVFASNTARAEGGQAYGGAMYVDGGSPTLTNVSFVGNVADVNWGGSAAGGGLYVAGGSATLVNVVFRKNFVAGYNTSLSGAGMSAGSATLTNVTFYDNYDSLGRGGERNDSLFGGTAVKVTNAIFWGDPVNSGSQLSGLVDVTYSIIQGGWPGQGNLDIDPLFIDPDNGNLRLKPNSPGVDSATSTTAPGFDCEGNPRPTDGSGDGTIAFDMGAYEAPTLINQAPVAEAGGPYAAYTGTSIALSACASYDPDVAIQAYEWDLDYDGKTFNVDTIGVWADFSAVSLTAGTKRSVALRVIDTSGVSSPVDVSTVTISDPLPMGGGYRLVSAIDDPTAIGVTGNGSSAEYYGAISDDGRYVVFGSSATNLVPGDTNGYSDIFLYDHLGGQLRRVSTDALGNQANGNSARPALSRNGRYLEFQSAATNLAVGGDSSSAVFLKDLVTGAIQCVSTDNAGNPANEYCFPSVPTDDGRYALFWSYASNLGPNGSNGQCQLYLKDMASGLTACVSTDSSGVLGNDYTDSGNVSGDGRYVLFNSYANNLVADDTNSGRDAFLKDLASGTTIRVSTDAVGGQADRSSRGFITNDGRYVLMISSATNLVAGDTNGVDDVFLKDLATGAVVRLSTDDAGTEANAASARCQLTSDGRYVLFESAANNLIADDTNGQTDVFRKDLISGATMRLIADVSSGCGTSGFYLYGNTPFPEYVAFSADANGIVSDDLNDDCDLFTRNVADGAVSLVSRCDPTVPGPIAAGLSTATRFSTSGDGRYVVFSSSSDNIVPGDTNGASDVFLKDMLTGTITRISTDRVGTQANGASTDPMLSAYGPYVLFGSTASNLVAGDTNGIADVFVKDLNTGTVTRVSTNTPTPDGPFSAFTPCAISPDGRYVAYTSCAVRYYQYSPIETYTLCVKDLGTGTITSLNHWGEQGYSITPPVFQAAFSNEGRYVAYSYTSSAGSWAYIPDLSTGDTLTLAGLATVAINGDAHCLVFTATSSIDEGDTNEASDVFVSVFGQGVKRVSTTSEGGLANGDSYNPVISSDGRYVVFTSSASNLVSGDINGQDDVFVKDLISGVVRCVSNNALGIPTGLSYYSYDAGTYCPAVSADGRFIVFQSFSGTITTGDGNGEPGYDDRAVDVFLAPNPLLETPPTDLLLSAVAVPDHAEAGTVVGVLSTTDPDNGDSFIYTLVAGDGDSDNWSFGIVGNQLTLLEAADRTTQAAYSIRVRTTDSLGRQSYEEVLTITVVAGRTTPALYDPQTSTFYLRCDNTTGMADYAFGFGQPGAGWVAIAGDWDGDGVSGVGLYDPQTSTFYLTDTCATGCAEYTFGYGQPRAGWTPIAGDWDGDGRAGVGLYDAWTSTFYLTNLLETGAAQYTFGYGQPRAGWEPVVGDWNSDRRADVGVYDPQAGTFYLTDERQTGVAQHSFSFGDPTRRWQPVGGDWNADGCAGVGLYDPRSSTFYLADTFGGGFADCTLGFGQPRAGWTPLAGCWPTASSPTAEAVDQVDLSELAQSTLNDLEPGLA
jgi:Tol biopolymer transport system component